jgi:hypothetical protein
MHYPTQALTFESAVMYNGKRFDVAIDQWPGHVNLQFNQSDLVAMKDSLVGFVNFNWKPVELECDKVIFDSIATNDLCTYFNVPSFSGTIGSFALCGVDEVEGQSPTSKNMFTITPNPAGDVGFVSSGTYEGAVTLTMYDLSGKLISTQYAYALPGSPMSIDLHDLSIGVYYLRISGHSLETALQIVHRK